MVRVHRPAFGRTTLALAAFAGAACLPPPEPLGAITGSPSADDVHGTHSGSATSGPSGSDGPPGRSDATAASGSGGFDTGARGDELATGGEVSGPVFPPGTLVLAAFGDYGTDSRASAQVGELVASWDPDHIFTTGDNNYPVGAATTIDDHIGQYYSAFIGNYSGDYGAGASTNRFWPSPGNHDWYAIDLEPYRDYFTLPGNERYYQVSLGLVELFAIDSDPHEPDGNTVDSVQAQWLQAALAGSTACWKLVYFHHPAYSSGSHGSTLGMRWPFAQWGADAVLAGHDHTYERLQVDGIPYFVTGLGGASRYVFPDELPESQLRYADEYGALVIGASESDLTFEFITVEGATIDVFTIDKVCGA